jgi:2-hydroxychromene-2-carboxylate isomerase
MAHVDYYFSPLSPYAYLAGLRLEEAAVRSGATITYKPIDIIALFERTGGTPPNQRHPARQEYRAQELMRWARKLDLPFTLKPAHWPTNAAPSSYAIISAQRSGGGDLGVLVHGILRACWAEEKDIADDGVIKSCLEQAGFDPSLADSGLLTGAEIYPANLEDAVACGVFGSPFYITGDDQRFWGQDRIDDLEAALTEGAT